MKKILLCIFMACHLLAIEVTQTKEFVSALDLYKNKEYQKAYDAFANLFENNLEDENVNYYLGRSAFMLKLYEDAISAYDRVLIRFPDNIRAKLEMARCYFELKEFEKSKEIFQEILTQKIPPQVAQSIEGYLVQIDKLQQRSFVSGAGIFGLVYDSNLFNASDSNQFYIPLYSSINNGIFSNTTTDDSDIAHQEILALTHIYDFGQIGSYALKTNAIVLSKTLFEYPSKNVLFYSLAPAITYKNDSYTWDMGLFYDRLWFGSELLMHTISAGGSFSHTLENGLGLSYSAKIQKKLNLVQTSKNKDAYNKSLILSANYQTENGYTLASSLNYAQERKISGILTNVDYDAYGTSLSISKELSDLYRATFGMDYKRTSYKDIDTQYLKKREDDTYGLSITLMRKLPYDMFGQAVLAYSNNSSNIVSSEYDKYTFTLNLIKPF